jgi:hypothetical protein
MKSNSLAAVTAAALVAFSSQSMADTGPSTATAPYVQAIAPGVKFTSILTTGDVVGGYKMGGIPDGLGAYDNDDGTFTVLMNHEIFANASGPLGTVRTHGGKGAYVSEWVISKRTLKVIAGADLMRNVYQQAADGSWVPVPATGVLGQTSSFARLCSADLAERSAFYDHATNRGTRQRIFLNGEESSPTYQRGLAHVATGPDKGSSYVLPWAANAGAAWENLLANPHAGERTVVIGNADGGTNGIYVYVGTKTDVGNDVERAGLINGILYRVAVNNTKMTETRAADAGLGLAVNGRGNYEGGFSLVAGPDTTNSQSTKFLRPEDGAWDRRKPNRYFFVTTDQMDAAKDGNLNSDIAAGQVGRSRLWALTFKNSARPERGGSIEMLLDGTGARGDYQMFDNLTVNDDGTLILQEDVGNNQHNGKVWKFDPATGSLVKVAGFDPALFGDIGKTGSMTKDEETSGVIDITDLLDRDDGLTHNLLVAQNHAPSDDPETVEGGQLLLMSHPARKRGKGNSHDDRDGDRR